MSTILSSAQGGIKSTVTPSTVRSWVRRERIAITNHVSNASSGQNLVISQSEVGDYSELLTRNH